jgi:GMP synthase (glutamine-hydrolysing)
LALRTAVALRHVAFEDLGILEPLLRRRGFDVSYLEAGVDSLGPALRADLLVVLGGPIGVYEAGKYPFVTDEIGLIERRLARGRPVLGICLGAQLIAAALGARVYPAGVKELGWFPIMLTDAGRRSCLKYLAPPRRVLHWHGDTFDLPDGATLLAATRPVANQAFQVPGALALQFHAEVDARGVERWLIGHTCEISGTAGVSVPGLRAATRRYAPGLMPAGRKLFDHWITRELP